MNTFNPRPRRIHFLASVRTVEEARIALQGGADIIDCKDPEAGALGALPRETIGEICSTVGQRVPVSATIGDDAVRSGDLVRRVQSTLAAGVDYVKIGLPRTAPWQDAVSQLSQLDGLGNQLVAVLLADEGVDMLTVDACARAGFAGVLIDTQDKDAGPLTKHLSCATLVAFIDRCRGAAMFAGLAGSLRCAQIGELAALAPDVLGFRGALCANHGRTQGLCAEKVAEINNALNKAQAKSNVALEPHATHEA